MASFRLKFEAGLSQRGFRVSRNPQEDVDAILIIGGTRNLLSLWRAKRRGVPIVQRLDGINWLHRQRYTGIRHFLRAEYGNLILALIRRQIATRIVYQSEFSKTWWEAWYGPISAPATVIHNGVDLRVYSPFGPHQRPADRFRLLVVEGSLGGGYDVGVQNAIRLAETLAAQHQFPVELMAVGKVDKGLQARLQAETRIPITWTGSVPRERIPEIDRSAHLLFSSDLNPACPNAVIEALACGLPVAAFDTGALSELVPPDAGRIVPYGGDVWKLDPPDIPALAEAAAEILQSQAQFRAGARARAESAFDLETMVERYLEVLLAA
jgi:glycosyltransferase involved in cell wall biosynthesis